jgi:hypothetical protein
MIEVNPTVWTTNGLFQVQVVMVNATMIPNPLLGILLYTSGGLAYLPVASRVDHYLQSYQRL